jgi:hypothetical protein
MRGSRDSKLVLSSEAKAPWERSPWERRHPCLPGVATREDRRAEEKSRQDACAPRPALTQTEANKIVAHKRRRLECSQRKVGFERDGS